jgi:DNA-directed RNA polymerase subunit RPC12/RpoP
MIVEIPVSCPHCHAPIIEGKLIGGGYPLKWIPDTEKLFLGIWARNFIYIEESYISVWCGRYSYPRCYVGSYFCNTCKSIIIDLTVDNISSHIPLYRNKDTINITDVSIPCPYCSSASMMKGKLLGGLYPLKWIPDLFFDDCYFGIGWFKNAIKIGDRSLLIRSSAPAYFCDTCNKIIINRHDN